MQLRRTSTGKTTYRCKCGQEEHSLAAIQRHCDEQKHHRFELPIGD